LAWPVLKQMIAAHQPAIVHVNGTRPGLLVLGFVPRHSHLVLHSRDLREPEIARRLLSRCAARIIVTSECVGRNWQHPSAAGKISVVNNGLDLVRVAATEPVSSFPWNREEHFIVIQVADMVEWKRHETFLQSIRIARERSSVLRAVVVGRPLTNEGDAYLLALRQRADDLGVADIVHFASGEEEAVRWIVAADVLVSTALAEPFGRTVVEALALGKPVVAVGACGPEEILGDSKAGTLVDEDPPSVAEGILRWVDPVVRRACASEAYSRASHFDAATMVETIMQLYSEILASQDGDSA